MAVPRVSASSVARQVDRGHGRGRASDIRGDSSPGDHHEFDEADTTDAFLSQLWSAPPIQWALASDDAVAADRDAGLMASMDESLSLPSLATASPPNQTVWKAIVPNLKDGTEPSPSLRLTHKGPPCDKTSTSIPNRKRICRRPSLASSSVSAAVAADISSTRLSMPQKNGRHVVQNTHKHGNGQQLNGRMRQSRSTLKQMHGQLSEPATSTTTTATAAPAAVDGAVAITFNDVLSAGSDIVFPPSTSLAGLANSWREYYAQKRQSYFSLRPCDVVAMICIVDPAREVMCKNGRTVDMARVLISDESRRYFPVIAWGTKDVHWADGLQFGDIVHLRGIILCGYRGKCQARIGRNASCRVLFSPRKVIRQSIAKGQLLQRANSNDGGVYSSHNDPATAAIDAALQSLGHMADIHRDTVIRDWCSRVGKLLNWALKGMMLELNLDECGGDPNARQNTTREQDARVRLLPPPLDTKLSFSECLRDNTVVCFAGLVTFVQHVHSYALVTPLRYLHDALVLHVQDTPFRGCTTPVVITADRSLSTGKWNNLSAVSTLVGKFALFSNFLATFDPVTARITLVVQASSDIQVLGADGELERCVPPTATELHDTSDGSTSASLFSQIYRRVYGEKQVHRDGISLGDKCSTPQKSVGDDVRLAYQFASASRAHEGVSMDELRADACGEALVRAKVMSITICSPRCRPCCDADAEGARVGDNDNSVSTVGVLVEVICGVCGVARAAQAEDCEPSRLVRQCCTGCGHEMRVDHNNIVTCKWCPPASSVAKVSQTMCSIFHPVYLRLSASGASNGDATTGVRKAGPAQSKLTALPVSVVSNAVSQLLGVSSASALLEQQRQPRLGNNTTALHGGQHNLDMFKALCSPLNRSTLWRVWVRSVFDDNDVLLSRALEVRGVFH